MLVLAVVMTEGRDCASGCDESMVLPFFGTIDINGGGMVSALDRTAADGLTGDLQKLQNYSFN